MDRPLPIPATLRPVRLPGDSVTYVLGKRAADELLQRIASGIHEPGDLHRAIAEMRGLVLRGFLARLEEALEAEPCF